MRGGVSMRRVRRTVGGSRQRGAVMLLFAMILGAILGTIAVVIELGLLRTSRERMQSATDSTAMEILRERDFYTSDAELIDPVERDYRRRSRNRWYASWVFASQHAGGEAVGLNSTYAEQEQGAGAYIDMTGGSGNHNLGQSLGVGDGSLDHSVGHAIPVLETNYDASSDLAAINAEYGDIVSGAFTGHANQTSSWVGTDGNPRHVEGANYQRVDFTAGDPTQAYSQDSVLVRMRRTVSQGYGGGSPLDVQENVSTSGWTVPLTFGSGSAILGGNPDSGHSVRHHGLSLRATSIAGARPALRAGAPRPDLGEDWEVGVAPFTMFEEAWRIAINWTSNGDGTDYLLLTLNSNLAMGATTSDHTVVGFLSHPIDHRVGDRIAPIDTQGDPDPYLTPDFWAVDEAYAPSLYRHSYVNEQGEPEGFRWYVAGFFRLKTELYVDENGVPILTQEGEEQIKMTRLNNPLTPGKPYIASRNASAALDSMQDWDLPDGVWEEILASMKEIPDLVQAPVLVR